jgi:phosphoethanolamine N-methyltransferase
LVGENLEHAFWSAQSSDARGMMLSDRASELDARERAEILGHLPRLEGADVLELGAGVGRYTRHFAQVARSVVAVDFVEAFIEANRRVTAGSPARVVHLRRDAMSVELDEQTLDLVFVNWLLMYLADDQAATLLDRIRSWLRPGGTLFLRESCFSASDPSAPHPNTRYRAGRFYADALASRFSISAEGNIKVYEELLANPNQLFWVARKDP